MSPLPPPLPPGGTAPLPTGGGMAATGRTPTFDPAHLQRFLSYIMRPGECYEVAALHAAHLSASVIGPAMRAMTLAGWYDSPAHVIADAQKLKGVAGYIIPNPTDYDLIARTHNRLHKQAARTKDDEIAVIRWAFLDIDETSRKRDTSATDAELAKAVAARESILDQHPEIRRAAIYGLSGNGCWILVRLPDYPNDPEHRTLLARFIAEMGRRFDHDKVEVDQHSKNPARLMCLPGTQKCKGENSTQTGRVWRLSTIDSPEGHEPAPLDLEAWLVEHEPPTAPPAPRATVAINSPVGGERERRIARAAAYVANIAPAVAGQGGHDQTFDAACALVKGFDLTISEARPILAAWNLACVPPWADHELEHKLADADARPDDKPRGYLFDADKGNHEAPAGYGAGNGDGKALLAAMLAAGGIVGLNGTNGHAHANGEANGHHGAGNGATNGLPLPPPFPPPMQGGQAAPAGEADAGPGLVPDEDPHRLARAFLDERYSSPDGPTLRFYQEEWHHWVPAAGCYLPRPQAEIRAEVAGWLHHEFLRLHEAALIRWAASKGKGGGGEGGEEKARKPVCKPVTCGGVLNVLQALTSFVVLNVGDAPRMPCWIGPHPWKPSDILPARNTLVHLPSWAAGQPYRLDPTPAYFSSYATDFDFDPDAPPPERWLALLEQQWGDDHQSIELLQEWMGYLLTPDTSLQKILMLIGPKRSGKGTIAKVITALLGEANVTSPTLSGLAGRFGLASLMGRPAAIVADARISGRTDTAVVVERLLSISGEDAQTIDRKNREEITVKLPTRFLIISNELPKMQDASGALVGRLLLLKMNESFFGREDPDLFDHGLVPELPGILLWAMAGWQRLRQRRRFIQPESGRDTLDAMEGISSPILSFVAERLRQGPAESVATADLYNAWRTWCQSIGEEHPGNEVHFGRNLRAALPSITKRRHRGDGGFTAYYHGIRLLYPGEEPDGPPSGAARRASEAGESDTEGGSHVPF